MKFNFFPRRGNPWVTLFGLGVLIFVVSLPNRAIAFGKKKSSILESGQTELSKKENLSRQSAVPKPSTFLSMVLKNGLRGLDSMSGESRKLILDHAKAFAQLARSKGRKKYELKAISSSFSGCDSGSTYTPFCELTPDDLNPSSLEGDQGARGRLKVKQRREVQRQVLVAKKWIQKSDFKELRALNPDILQKSLRFFSKSDQLQSFNSWLTSTQDCENISLHLQLAIKLEEFFPEKKAVESSIRNYQRVIACQKGDLTEKASYRLGMIQVLNQKCDEARPHLERLAYTTLSKDYGSRALYWLASCEKESKHTAAYDRARRALLESYPFSLHSLLLQSEDLSPVKSIISTIDSPIRFRTERLAELNPRVVIVESLIQIKERGLAKKLLVALMKELKETEPEFQVYIAALLNEVGDNLDKFKILNAVFHTHPEMLSRTAMELYYPHRQIELTGLDQKKVDQYLILSLIRQESAFDERALSISGARGLMQLMPQTARRIERIRTKDLFNPVANVRIGTKYFSSLVRRYGGDVQLALAAYNAGVTRVEEWGRRYPASNRLLFLDLIPFKETREYVSSVARNYFWYSFLYMENGETQVPGLKFFGS